jgi:hypothetical protein
LHNLEKISKVAGAEATRINKRIHEEALMDAIKLRSEIQREIHQTEGQIILKRALDEVPTESRTADTPAEEKVTSANDLPLSVLEKKKEHQKEQLAKASEAIQREAAAFDDIDSVSGSVAAKQKELKALEQIMTELRGEVDRARLERLAQERITKVDDAQLASPDGDRTRRYVGFSAALAVSLALAMVGLLVGRRNWRVDTVP